MASGKGSGGGSRRGTGGGGGKGKAGSAKGKQPASQPNTSAVKATDGMSRTQKVVWFSILGLTLLVPIAMSNANWIYAAFPSLPAFQLPFTYDQFDIIKVFVMRAFVLVGLGAWCFDFFLNGGKLRRSKLDWLILVFLGWVLLTSIVSISPATAFFGKYRRFEGFFSFVTYAAVFFLVTQVVDRPSRIRALARMLVISGFIVALYGVMQYVGLDPINWGSNLPFEASRAFSTFGNPDLLGGFLIFPLAISIALALSEPRTGWRIFYWIAFLTTVACWIVSFVRGAWIGGTIALALVAVAAILAQTKLKTVDWVFTGVTGVSGAALIGRSLTSSNSVMNVGERLASILQFGQGSSQTRFEIWQAAISAIKARPFFGFGADTFRLVFPKYKPLSYVRDAGYLSVADNVHDYPLQLMAGIGVIGFLILYGLFGWALWLGAPTAFSRGKGTERLVVAGFWAAIVGYIAHLFTGLSVTGSTVFLWMALAVIVTPLGWTKEFQVKRWGPAAALVTVALLAAAWGYNVVWVVADNFFLRGQFSQAGDNVGLLKTAIALDPYNDQYRAILGQTYYSQMRSYETQANTDKSAGKDTTQDIAGVKTAFLSAEATFKQTIAFVPTEYDNYVFLAQLYNDGGLYLDPAYFSKALATADKGIEVEPNGPAIRLQKALAYAYMNETAKAEAVLKATVGMDPNYADPRQLYAQILTQARDFGGAAAQYRLLLKLKPGDPALTSALQAVEASLSAETTAVKK